MTDNFVRDVFAWLDQVGADGEIKPSAFRVAYAIVRHVNRREGKARPSQARLMETTSFAKPTVQRSIYELAKRGHLEIESGQGRHVVSKYKLINTSSGMPFFADGGVDGSEIASPQMPFLAGKGISGDVLSTGKGITGDPKRHHGRCTELFEEPFKDSLPPAEQGGARAAQQSVMLLAIEGGKKPSKHEYPPEFEQAWAAFGNCRGFNRNMTKAESFKAWLSLKDDRPPAPILVACIQAYARDLEANQWRQMKYPAAWLRARKWEGFLPAVNKPAQTGYDERLAAAKASYGRFADPIIAELRKHSGDQQDRAEAKFREWFGRATLVEGPPHRIACNSEHVARWISREFGPWLEKLLGEDLIVQFKPASARVA